MSSLMQKKPPSQRFHIADTFIVSCVFLHLFFSFYGNICCRCSSRHTVHRAESRHDIGQFLNFRRSRDGDGTLEIAAAPRTQHQQHL